MFTTKALNQVGQGLKRWLREVNHSNASQNGRRFSTVSDLELKPLYTPDDIKDIDFEARIGYPGQFPFTRGCQPTGYRGKVWTYRMFSGFGTAEDTNVRWHKLLEEGETGLSTAFDFPTLMGYDSDSPLAQAECGKCGVAIDTLADFELLTRGIPLDKVTTSMTINPPATVLWAMY
ncbi:MAG: methylmalonyl-CoA mutase, partial [Chloroflexi bacterium]|nr:methylmalonyl-CoA mutase [Chloroflexota bacterium]